MTVEKGVPILEERTIEDKYIDIGFKVALKKIKVILLVTSFV